MPGSVIFVHGTGVRLPAYSRSFQTVRGSAAKAGIQAILVDCIWGEPFGSSFEGKSLPDPPDEEVLERNAQELARWTWLFEDPLAELERLSIRSGGEVHSYPGHAPEWLELLQKIQDYLPSLDTASQLKRAGIEDLWTGAFGEIIASPVVAMAFESSAQANELADAGIALSRAVVARLYVAALEKGRSPVSGAHREAISNRLQIDWGVKVLGLGDLLAGFAKRVGTNVMRKRRNAFNAAVTGPIGDILLYQSRGQNIREFVREKVELAEPPVTLVAHSLGGIACVDMLALPCAPKVKCLVTLGSQAPYFYEIGALTSIRHPDNLPETFPPWLNIFDRSDFLSFVGHRLFGDKVTDFEIRSATSFPEAHSAYLGSEEAWAKVKSFAAL